MEKVKKQGMESFFCPYELALELKELGFDEISLFCYTTAYEGNPLLHCPHLLLNSQLEGFENEPISAPLYQQAFRWFREKHNLICYPVPCDFNRKDTKFDFIINGNVNYRYLSYEEAELECLVKLIDIAKEQNVK